MRTWLLSLAALFLFVAPSRAEAGSDLPSTAVGARVAMLRGTQANAHTLFGGGVSVERSMLSHLLELELVAVVLPGDHEVLVPLELLLKVPFHPTPWLQPYFGAGPAVGVAFREEGQAVHLGGAGVVGTYFWVSRGLGLMVELNYEVLYDHGLVHELGSSAGVLWAF